MVGDQIRKYRISQDITQMKLAQKMGISRQTLSKIETNKQPVTKDMIYKAAEALQVNYLVLIESDLIQNKVFWNEAVDRISQASRNIHERTTELGEKNFTIDNVQYERKMRTIRNIIILVFGCLLLMEIIHFFVIDLCNR